MQNSKVQRVQGMLLLFLTALIWGFAFVAQSVAMDSVGPFTFGAVRFFLGGGVLLLFLLLRRVLRLDPDGFRGIGEKRARRHTALVGGLFCGAVLAVASMLQQFGISYTTTAKAGFLTALYIIIVPLYSIFMGRRPGRNVFIGALLAMLGLYLLCMEGSLRISKGDTLCILSAFCFPFQILGVQYFGEKTDPVVMSCVQFFSCAVICAVPALLFEEQSGAALRAAAIPILYTGILSSSVAYTLQAVGQMLLRNPSLSSLCMSFESVFAALAGWLILHQTLSPRKLLGCAVMFAAILIAQR